MYNILLAFLRGNTVSLDARKECDISFIVYRKLLDKQTYFLIIVIYIFKKKMYLLLNITKPLLY